MNASAGGLEDRATSLEDLRPEAHWMSHSWALPRPQAPSATSDNLPPRLDETDLMRFKGKISEWNDDRGFGFIAPAEAGARVLCHIKASADRSSRPEVGKTVTYELAKDARGRPRASQIRYAGSVKPPPVASQPSRSSLTQAVVGASVFLLGLAALVVTSRAPWWLLPWYLVLSVVTFMLYGWDKVSARGGHWRTQESTLNGLALLGLRNISCREAEGEQVIETVGGCGAAAVPVLDLDQINPQGPEDLVEGHPVFDRG